MTRLPTLLLPVLMLPACALMSPAPSDDTMTQQTRQTELLPRTVLFGNPDRAQARLSPDGTRISWLAPRDGVLNVWVAPLDDLDAAQAVTQDTGRGIRVHFWAYDNRHLLYLQDEGGDENWRLHAVDLKSGTERDLTPFDGVAAQVLGVSHERTDEILVGLNDRNPALHDVHLINIVTGERRLIVENPGYAGYWADEQYNVRLAFRSNADGSMTVLMREDDAFEPAIEIPQIDTLSTSVHGFMPDDRRLLMSDSRERDTAALVIFDPNSGTREVVFEDARADVGVSVHPRTREIEAAVVDYERPRWHPLNDAIRADIEFLEGFADGDLNVTSRTIDDRLWLVGYNLSDRPFSYYLYDRETQDMRFLFTTRQALADAPLVPMHSRVITARDGLQLVSYLTLPPGSDPKGDGVPTAPAPLVLNVHGGPWARDSWGMHPEHQWLANRGYAVLSVNFRGSTGFGKNFIAAADREWAGKMHDDLIDAVEWAIAQGITTREQVAIYGGSYGGYATLVGLTFTPEVFACGVDIVGPSSLVTLLESIPPYWQPMIELFTTRVGDHRTEEGREFLKSRSPLFFVDRIQRPLLIAQGANDPRVKQPESDQIVEAMTQRDIPVTYALFPDEGHGFARPANRLSFFAVAEAFLGECLGGRVEPFGKDLDGASLQVPVGAGFISGLSKALE